MQVMDKKTLQERQRRKQQQLRRRVMIRLGLYGLGLVLFLVFLVRGIFLPIFHLVTGRSGDEVVETVPVQETDPNAAVRMPLKGVGDGAKLMAMNPGWHGEGKERWYQNPDGTYYADGFLAIDGEQYYFTEDGYLATGWVENGAREFYFDEDGSYVPDMVRPSIALTFDDGPGEYTDDLLNCLEEYGAHATFFMVGQNVGLYPETVQHMLRAGCELGNHSWDHAQLSTLTAEQIANEFDSTDTALIEACGQASAVIRAPYGDYNDTVLSIGGKPFFMWSLDSLDWSYKDAQLDYEEIMNKGYLTDGTIVLMHDIHEPSVECAKRIIPELVEKGYRLLTVSELAESKGVELQDSTSYTDFWPVSLESGLVPGYEGQDQDSSDDIGFTPTYGSTPAPASSYSTSSFTSSSKKKTEEEEYEEEDAEEEEEKSEDRKEKSEDEDSEYDYEEEEEEYYEYEEEYEEYDEYDEYEEYDEEYYEY